MKQIFPYAIVLGLVALLVLLLVAGRGPDPAVRQRLQVALQSVLLHDAQLNRDVLLARAGLLPHYDSLTTLGRLLESDLATLQREEAALPEGTRAAIAEPLRLLSASVHGKLRLVEHVKSDNALLRNSLAYFTQSMQQLAARREQGRPAVAVTALTEVMLRFVQTPDDTLAAELQSALARVDELTGEPADLAPLVDHGRLIMRLLPGLDSSVARIIDSPTSVQAEELQRRLTADLNRENARANRSRVALFAVTVALLGYAVYQVRRVRARTRELQRKDAQLIHANRLTSLGMLVSGMAHEVKTPNQLVLMNAETLARTWTDAVEALASQPGSEEMTLGGVPFPEVWEAVPALIRQMRDGARRIDRIVGDLREFVRPAAREPVRYQVNDVVTHALRLLQHFIHTRTERFSTSLADRLPCVHGDPQHLEQVVVNLVINALEALPDRRRAVRVATWHEPPQHVVLEVADEGVGIPRDHLPRLGEPFFTTKAATGGTGLGIAIARSLVHLHRGRLEYRSAPGRGTRAVVQLPCADNEHAGERLPIGIT